MTRYFTGIVLSLLMLAPLKVSAQLTSPLSSPTSIPALASPDKALTPPVGEAVFGSAVDAREYHLGPGDVLLCKFWTSGQSLYPTVSADDRLVVHNVGEFDVRGKTLADIQKEVYAKADNAFAEGHTKSQQPPVSLSIYQPRKLFVKVRGDVLTQSVYALTGATRADVAVDLANKPATEYPSSDPALRRQIIAEGQRKKEIESFFGSREPSAASQRYITVAHTDGTVERLDMVRYNATHDPAASPLLRESDVIHVPFRDAANGSIGVYGAVQAPGDFEYVKGDSVSSAIKYAFGLSPNADPHHVEVGRMSADGGAVLGTVCDLDAIMAHREPDIALERNDRIIVRAKQDTRSAAVVAVRGEVGQPGTYSIVDGKTTLTEVIKAAGGVSTTGFPSGGVILRHGHFENMSTGTPEEIAQSTRMENLGVSDTGNLRRQFSLRIPAVNVDMERALVKGEKDADVAMQDGDEIVIPQRPSTVFVSGFVNYAGYVPYQPGARLSYYIARAGGYAAGAQSGKTTVIKMRLKTWMDPSDTEIEPGDEIFVPKESDYSEEYQLQKLTTIVAMVGAAIAAVSLYVNITRK